MTQDQPRRPEPARAGSDAPIVTLGQSSGAGGSESTLTVLIAFTSNLLVAIAKTWAAALTGSASMVAEAAHSWADTGNEIFLMIANRLSRKPAEPGHPLGYGREAYVWSLFAALGLFVAGSAVSITHGIHELITPEPATRLRDRLPGTGTVLPARGNLLPAVRPAGPPGGARTATAT